MSSGATVSSSVNEEFQKLKQGSLSFIVCNLSKDLKEIVVDNTSTGTDWEDFLTKLPEDECRWAIYDLHLETQDGGKKNKIVFICWSPDIAKIKQKMLFASSRDTLKRNLVGLGSEIQATEYDEVAYEYVVQHVSRGR